MRCSIKFEEVKRKNKFCNHCLRIATIKVIVKHREGNVVDYVCDDCFEKTWANIFKEDENDK